MWLCDALRYFIRVHCVKIRFSEVNLQCETSMMVILLDISLMSFKGFRLKFKYVSVPCFGVAFLNKALFSFTFWDWMDKGENSVLPSTFWFSKDDCWDWKLAVLLDKASFYWPYPCAMRLWLIWLGGTFEEIWGIWITLCSSSKGVFAGAQS